MNLIYFVLHFLLLFFDLYLQFLRKIPLLFVLLISLQQALDIVLLYEQILLGLVLFLLLLLLLLIFFQDIFFFICLLVLHLEILNLLNLYNPFYSSLSLFTQI